MALTVEIQKPLSATWTDITEHVADGSLELERTAWSDDYGHAPDLLRASIRHQEGSDLSKVMLHADRRIPVKVSDGATVIFRGAVMPTIRQTVEEVVGDVQLEVVDQSWRLDRDCTSFAYQGYKVFDPSNTAQSIVHQRLFATGFASNEIDALVSITATVGHVSRTAGDQTELDFIADLLTEYGYVIYFRPDGVFSVRRWRRTSISASTTFDATNMRGSLTIERRDLTYEAVEIEWSEVATGANYLVYRENIPTNSDGEFTGIVILSDLYFPTGGADRAVWQQFRTEWMDTSENDNDSALLAVTNPSLIYRAGNDFKTSSDSDSDIEVVKEVYESLRARVLFHNDGTDNNKRLFQFDIRGNVVFRRTRRYSSAELRGRSGFARGGTTTTIILDAEASTVDDYYTGLDVEVDDVTRRITDYDGDTQTATVNAAWTNAGGDPATPANGARYRIFSGTKAIERVKADFVFDSATAADYAVGLRDAAEYGRLSFQFRATAADAVDPGTIVRITSDAPPINLLAVVTRRRQILGSPDHPLVDLEAVGVGPLRRDDALDGDAVMTVVPAALLQQIDETKLTPWEAVEGFDRGGGTTTPTAPTLQAWAEGRFMRLTWDRQYLLTNLDHYDMQGSQDETNWYSLENDGDDWKDTVDATTRHDSEEYLHVAIPLDGTDDYPTGRTLHYRVRRVTRAATEGPWSNVATATAYPLTRGDLAESIVSAAKIDPARFLRGFDDGLVAYWSLDDVDTSGSTAITPDNSGNDYHLTVYGSPSRVAGISGTAIDLLDAQTTKYLQRSSFTGLSGANELTISCWLKPDSYNWTAVYFKAGTVVVRLSTYNSNRLRWAVGSRLAQYTTTALTDGGWHHVVCTWMRTTDELTMWLDGVAVGDLEGTGPTAVLGSSGLLQIGNLDPRTADEAFHGRIDETRVYNRVLDEAEIKFLKLVPAGPTPGMIIADRLIARGITAKYISTDALAALTAEVQELVIGINTSNAHGKWVSGAGLQRGYLDQDEILLQRRASASTNWSSSHNIARLLANANGGQLDLYNVAGTIRTLIRQDYVRIQQYISGAWVDVIWLKGDSSEIRMLRGGNSSKSFRIRAGLSDGNVRMYLHGSGGLLAVNRRIQPNANNTYDLGAQNYAWRDLYVGRNIGEFG